MLRWRRGSQNLADEWVRDRWFGAPESCAVAFLRGLFGPLTLAETNPWAAAVLVDEFDAGKPKASRIA